MYSTKCPFMNRLFFRSFFMGFFKNFLKGASRSLRWMEKYSVDRPLYSYPQEVFYKWEIFKRFSIGVGPSRSQFGDRRPSRGLPRIEDTQEFFFALELF